MAAPDWQEELAALAEAFPETGVIHDLPDMTTVERYGVLLYLRSLAAERDARSAGR